MTAYAEGMEGTGLLSVPPPNDGFGQEITVTATLALNEQGRLVLNAREGDFYISGNAVLSEQYVQFSLDYYNAETGLLVPAWGEAEVVLNCAQAEILISQGSTGKDNLFAAGVIDFPFCAK